ncbi:MAG: ABC transporter ATP-binding protein, partial [Myxococcota bacterium]|nr:ABC transporter ATP-binding protein [Myxococcota bacterium]
MTVLRVEKLYKSFRGVKAVQDLSFSVNPGMICGFIGPNGAGKTTTMRIISTLLLPDKGMVWVNGHSVLTHPREVRASIGFMPDHFEMEDALTVRDLIEFYAAAHGLRGNEKEKAIRDVVDFTGLSPLMEKQSTSLSKGMRQRAALAVTMIHDPKLLILDEPAAGLDPRARIELRSLLRVVADMGKAVLISSHILAELSEICDQVVVLEKGRLMGDQNVQDLQQQSVEQTKIYVQADCALEH